jgi:4-hydroxybenzoate polyprenyltransferase
MRTALRTIHTWGEMIKFSHSLFALPFALLATFLAARPRLPGAAPLALIVVCMIAARSAAMTFNRIADLEIDAKNPRTAGRPLQSGRISLAAAWLFFIGACALFLVACAGFWWLASNPWPLRLSIPVLLLLCGYSYAKHFTRWSHVMLGAAIAFSPVAAWIAINPATLGATAWLLLAAVTFWIGGFDVIYACQDVEFDRQVGLQSLPAALGVAPALWIARGFHLITVAALLAVGWTAGLGAIYFVGVACVGLLLVVENAIVHPHDLSRVNLAFFTVNGVVGLLLGALGVLDVCLGA